MNINNIEIISQKDLTKLHELTGNYLNGFAELKKSATVTEVALAALKIVSYLFLGLPALIVYYATKNSIGNENAPANNAAQRAGIRPLSSDASSKIEESSGRQKVSGTESDDDSDTEINDLAYDPEESELSSSPGSEIDGAASDDEDSLVDTESYHASEDQAVDVSDDNASSEIDEQPAAEPQPKKKKRKASPHMRRVQKHYAKKEL